MELNSTYEPYRVAAPRPQARRARSVVDQPAASTAARHAARTADPADRARARAVIANQAATLRNRAWPRSAEADTPVRRTAVKAPAEVPAPVDALTQFEVPAIRQAAIPQRRNPQQPQTAQSPAAASVRGRPAVSGGPRPGQEARSGWSWLPPLRSYDDAQRDHAGEPQPGTSPVPELQPPDGERRSVRT
jgi:hypothetical protein